MKHENGEERNSNSHLKLTAVAVVQCSLSRLQVTDGPAVLLSCGNSKVARGKRNTELMPARPMRSECRAGPKCRRAKAGCSEEEVMDSNEGRLSA